MLKLLNLFIVLFSISAWASNNKFEASYGLFAINAKASGESSSISSPSAFHVAYLYQVKNNLDLNLGYSVLLADLSGSDIGYGVDVGFNYFPFTKSSDETFKDEKFDIRSYEIWRPYIGLSFNQRNFQSIKNAYAGFGFSAGTEKYLNEKVNLKAEARYINMSGSNESTATETALMFGVVYKL